MTGIVLVHGKAREVVDRHLPNWQAGFSQVILICPSDDPIPGAIPLGKSEQNGRGLMERMIFAVVMASRFPTAAILEYDALVFAKLSEMQVPPNSITCSNVFENQGDKFEANAYGHCPWIARGDTWWKIATAGANAQYGFSDRWIALAAQRSDVVLQRFVTSFTNDKPWTDKDRAHAAWCVKSGAPVIHGVKTEKDFLALT